MDRSLEKLPAYRALLESLAVEMKHLDPASAPKGEDTTKLDLLGARIERMLDEGPDQCTRDWLVEFLDRLVRWQMMHPALDRLDQLARERDR